GLAAETSQRRPVVAQYFARLVGEEPAKDQPSAGRDDSLQMRRVLDQCVTQNIGHDEIEAAMNRSERHRRKSNRFFHAVQARIGTRVFQHRRIDIDGYYFGLETLALAEQR